MSDNNFDQIPNILGYMVLDDDQVISVSSI
jgi:hypothetical protein